MTTQPSFKFFIFRPDGTVTPLIPLDQLPSWLWIRGRELGDPDINPLMVPALHGLIPRDGEFDVICCNCYSTVDALHRSPSERHGRAPPSPPGSAAAKQCRSFPGAYGPSRGEYPLFPEIPGLLPGSLQSPMVGMCLVDFRCPFIPAQENGSSSGSDSPKSKLNPEAAAFRPPTAPVLYAPSSFVRNKKVEDDGDTYLHSNRSSLSSLTVSPKPPTTADQMPSAHSDQSSPSSRTVSPDQSPLHCNTVEALEQLKKLIGVGGDMKISVSSHISAIMNRRPSDKHGYRTLGRKGNKSYVRRHSRKMRTKRLGKRNVAFRPDRPRQVNSYTKRQDRREKMMHNKHQARPGGSYWHRMMPTWRSRVRK